MIYSSLPKPFVNSDTESEGHSGNPDCKQMRVNEPNRQFSDAERYELHLQNSRPFQDSEYQVA